MTREYAKLRLDMWVTGDIRHLSPPAQHLYFVLISHPQISYCGVADWRPGRLTPMADGWTVEAVLGAAEELVAKLFVVIDETTEEVLVRSFIRNDGLMKEARMAVSMVKAFGAVASAALRGVIVHELRRLHVEEPDLKGWRTTKGEPGQALTLLGLETVDPADLPHDLPIGLGQGLGQGLGVGLGQGLGVGLGQGLGVGLGQTPSGVWGSVWGSTSPVPVTVTRTPSKDGGGAVSDSDPRKRGSRIPEDFAPNEVDRAKAKQLGFSNADLDRITASFIDYWRAKPGKDGVKLDWDATWRNWVRKEATPRNTPTAAAGRIVNEWDMPRTRR